MKRLTRASGAFLSSMLLLIPPLHVSAFAASNENPAPRSTPTVNVPSQGHEGDEEGNERKRFGRDHASTEPLRHIEEHNEEGFEVLQIGLVGLALALAALLAYRAGRRRGKSN